MTNDEKVEALRRELEEITKLGEDLGNALRRIEVLEKALQRAVDLYGKPGGPWNVPNDPGGWLATARAALANDTASRARAREVDGQAREG